VAMYMYMYNVYMYMYVSGQVFININSHMRSHTISILGGD
jgi:hypothetical protein